MIGVAVVECLVYEAGHSNGLGEGSGSSESFVDTRFSGPGALQSRLTIVIVFNAHLTLDSPDQKVEYRHLDQMLAISFRVLRLCIRLFENITQFRLQLAFNCQIRRR